jgi:hypothetical protein
MTRLFTFGCSFTNSKNPTWADIVSREYNHYENWGQAGAGNSFIFYSLMECNKRNTITQNDVVMIMWSSIGREDRYVDGKWLTPGSIYNQTDYDENFVNKFTDPTGYLLRDAAHLAGAKSVLESIGCKYYFFSIVPFNVPDDNIFKIFSIDNKILNVYANEFKSVRPSVYEVIFDHNWYSRVGIKEENKLKEEYKIKRGNDWPTWDKFIIQDFTGISKDIEDEINIKNEFTNRYLYRYDTHPTPAEYLEYITRVAPDIEISQTTQDWVATVTERLIEHKDLFSLWRPSKKPTRF